MAKDDSGYGRDLMIISEEADEEQIITDVSLTKRGDFDTIKGRDLMVQAIRHRLMTRKGELASLGHPEYGSLLEEVIGEPNTPETHRVIETLVRDCLKHEGRIRNIRGVNAFPSDKKLDVVHITVHVELVSSGEEMKITYPLYLEG